MVRVWKIITTGPALALAVNMAIGVPAAVCVGNYAHTFPMPHRSILSGIKLRYLRYSPVIPSSLLKSGRCHAFYNGNANERRGDIHNKQVEPDITDPVAVWGLVT